MDSLADDRRGRGDALVLKIAGTRSLGLLKEHPNIPASSYVEDLIWAINSPSLICDAPIVSPVEPHQVDTGHLTEFLQDSPDPRVGRYFERLVLYWLQHIRRVEIVADSLQLRDQKRTIGELDFLFRDEQGRLTHWETAIKFYLHVPDAPARDSQYIGPNVRDTFEHKMQRLFAEQLPRSEKYSHRVEVRQAFVKGRIFYHQQAPVQTGSLRYLSPGHLRSVWIRAAEVTAFCDDGNKAYRILEKPHWLSAQTALRQDSSLLSGDRLREQLAEHFAAHDRCVLISELVAGLDSDEILVESQRIFIVPDSWPSHFREGR